MYSVIVTLQKRKLAQREVKEPQFKSKPLAPESKLLTSVLWSLLHLTSCLNWEIICLQYLLTAYNSS